MSPLQSNLPVISPGYISVSLRFFFLNLKFRCGHWIARCHIHNFFAIFFLLGDFWCVNPLGRMLILVVFTGFLRVNNLALPHEKMPVKCVFLPHPTASGGVGASMRPAFLCVHFVIFWRIELLPTLWCREIPG